MERKEKILFAKKQIAETWKCDPAVFESEKNVFYATKDTFFEIITFGTNAVIRADEAILDWCLKRFESVLARDIMDGDNLYDLDTKLRSLGKKLSGEHIRYLHIFPEKIVMKPETFTYRLFVGDEIAELRLNVDCEVFSNAFSTDKERDVLAIAAYDGETVAAIVGKYNWQHRRISIMHGLPSLPKVPLHKPVLSIESK